MVNSALRMLALYMCFKGTGIWDGETSTAFESGVRIVTVSEWCVHHSVQNKTRLKY